LCLSSSKRSSRPYLTLIRTFIICSIIFSAFIFFNISLCKAEKNYSKKFNEINKIIQRISRKGAKIGCLIVHSKTNQVLWSYHPDDPLIPASNTKLLTSAVSLIRLGPDYRFKTGVYSTTPPVDGIINGDLYLKGFGDPFLVNEQMWMLTHELALRGLKKITGDLIADETFFDQIRSPKGWKKDRPPFWYNAEIGALSFNFNTATIYIHPGPSPGQKAIGKIDPDLSCISLENEAITIKKSRKKYINVGRDFSEGGGNLFLLKGRIPIDSPTVKIYRAVKDPAIYTITAFRNFLKQEGIEFDGELRKGVTPQDAIPFYIYKSKPLSRIVADLNKISNNFIAEQIVKTIGAEIEGPSGTHEKGLSIIRETLEEKGIKIDGLKLFDGSGLSSLNRIPARLICDLLFFMANSEQFGPEFISSLSIYGIDGTLKERPLKGETHGTIRAKTGRIRGVSALSGYIWTISGEPLIFSILMNGKQSQIEYFMNSQDKILSILSTI
jgi:D-alanyl-D-alanine carboxypeptidase/D-alanyl-D-alanine-endopeptidase (penicillin-binding protein 4)